MRIEQKNILPDIHNFIIEHLGDGVLILDTQKRILALNQVSRKLFGYTALQAIGQPVRQIWPTCPKQIEEPTYSAGLQLQTTLGDGNAQRTYTVLALDMLNQQEQLISRAVILHDITECKQEAPPYAPPKKCHTNSIRN